MYEANS